MYWLFDIFSIKSIRLYNIVGSIAADSCTSDKANTLKITIDKFTTTVIIILLSKNREKISIGERPYTDVGKEIECSLLLRISTLNTNHKNDQL